MADLVTPPGSDAAADSTPGHQVELLWEGVCDLYPGVEVASRHALEDSELRAEDLATLDAIGSLRVAFERCRSRPGLSTADMWLLADVDARLQSLEGRAEILVLAVA